MLNRRDVQVLGGPPNATCHLVAVEMGVAHREEREVNLLEDATLQQPAEESDEDGILVLTDAVVQLEVEAWRKISPLLQFTKECAVQDFAG